ncbi:PepSY-associated TM helix domain-containing protein [Comamonas testosteroni]|uniref:PepSY-associated TM helix domain-containing protein n=1 Tax=Comamonas testosteroni TaxID=285 RepID=UPI0015FACC07|nr:PepSY-associated TM helix domain-containing protein [Comamonas testosteroni]
MSGKPASQPGLRQTMSWLHTWCGLVCGWLLCAIFLTGSISVFREPITLWMQGGPLEGSGQQPLSLDERLLALRLAEQHLSKTAPDASIWRIGLPLRTGEGVKVFAHTQDGDLQASLHAQTGEALPEPATRETEGGRHFMSFHYSLQGGIAGFWVVGLVSMCMMVALVSGVIVHRRIFQDFFTFRPGKGQRSWLDAHNASAVLTLPFLFMIVYTGLAHFYTSYMPWPLHSLYGQDRSAYSRYESELSARPKANTPSNVLAIAAVDLVSLAQQPQPLLTEPVVGVVVQRPEGAPATIRFTEGKPETAATRRLVNASRTVTFDAVSGQVLEPPTNPLSRNLASDTYPVISALHLITFGGWTMKWLYFVLGLIGTAMIATGSILFAVKRRAKSGHEWGGATHSMYRSIDALNVAALAGAALASIAYLYGNRLLPLVLEERSSWEIRVFFAVWALSLLHALLRTTYKAWREQLWMLALLCLGLPLLNAITTGHHLLLYLAQGDDRRGGLELTCMALGLLVAWGAWRHEKSQRSKSVKQQRAGRGAVTGGLT